MYLISKIILLFGFVALELKGNYKVSGLVLFEKVISIINQFSYYFQI